MRRKIGVIMSYISGYTSHRLEGFSNLLRFPIAVVDGDVSWLFSSFFLFSFLFVSSSSLSFRKVIVVVVEEEEEEEEEEDDDDDDDDDDAVWMARLTF